MNGRVYDPGIGQFLSADPNIPHPYNAQSYNRYSYVLNNPLSLVDPSGFVDTDAIDLGTVTVDGSSVESWNPMVSYVVEFFRGMSGHRFPGIGINTAGMSRSEVQRIIAAAREAGYVPADMPDAAGLDEDGFATNMLDGAQGYFSDLFRVLYHYKALNGELGLRAKKHALRANKAITAAAYLYYEDAEISINGKLIGFRSMVNSEIGNSIMNNKAYFVGRQLVQTTMITLLTRYTRTGFPAAVGLIAGATTISGFGRALTLYDRGVRDPILLMSGMAGGVE